MQQGSKWGGLTPFKEVLGGTEENFEFLCTLDSARVEAYAFATGDYNEIHHPEGEEKILNVGSMSCYKCIVSNDVGEKCMTMQGITLIIPKREHQRVAAE